MFWRFNKYLVEESVNFMRRVFRYNKTWTNTGLEIVQFPSGSEQLVFEQFFEENERYPVITVGSQGGNLVPAAINDVVDVISDDGVILGDRSHSKVTISNVFTLAVQLPSGVLNEKIRGVKATLAWTGSKNGGDDITVELYRNYSSTGILIASGSIEGVNDIGFKTYYVDMFPTGSLTGGDYWLKFQTGSGSTYYMGIDTDATTKYQSNESGSVVTATGSLNGSVTFPPYYRLGGNFESSLTIRCMSKNDTSSAFSLADLVSQYFILAKHAQLTRRASGIDGLSLAYLTAGAVSEFTSKDIYIRGVRVGAVENRRRGENDLIFTVPVSVDFFGSWYQDFPADTVSGFGITVNQINEEVVTVF